MTRCIGYPKPFPAISGSHSLNLLQHNKFVPLTYTRKFCTLTFFVNKEGRPFDIKVKESLCKSLDKEAIRLIQEGPDWTYGNQSAEITVKFHK